MLGIIPGKSNSVSGFAKIVSKNSVFDIIDNNCISENDDKSGYEKFSPPISPSANNKEVCKKKIT